MDVGSVTVVAVDFEVAIGADGVRVGVNCRRVIFEKA
jgi:hypothetical protein